MYSKIVHLIETKRSLLINSALVLLSVCRVRDRNIYLQTLCVNVCSYNIESKFTINLK